MSSIKMLREQEDDREIFEVRLEKDTKGLGLTVAGYICEKGKHNS